MPNDERPVVSRTLRAIESVRATKVCQRANVPAARVNAFLSATGARWRFTLVVVGFSCCLR